jgi:hypothetical protein
MQKDAGGEVAISRAGRVAGPLGLRDGAAAGTAAGTETADEQRAVGMCDALYDRARRRRREVGRLRAADHAVIEDHLGISVSSSGSRARSSTSGGAEVDGEVSHPAGISVSTSDRGGDDARAQAGSANARSGGCRRERIEKADGESQRGEVERNDEEDKDGV